MTSVSDPVLKRRSLLHEARSKLVEVVDFAIEDDDIAVVAAVHRLVAGSEVDNRQTAVPEETSPSRHSPEASGPRCAIVSSARRAAVVVTVGLSCRTAMKPHILWLQLSRRCTRQHVPYCAPLDS